jgi:hypothetical protein
VVTERRLVLGAAADDYARHRPDYPPEPVAWALEHAAGPRVLDLAAGTGAVDWVMGYARSLAHGRSNPRGGDGAELDLPEPFGPTERAEFRNDRPTTTEELVASLRTHSWALMTAEADREAAFDRMRAYLATRPETASGSFVLPGFTLVLRSLRS